MALVVALVATLLPVGWSGAVVTAGSDGGPDVVHVPVATTFHGRALPIEATVTCDAGAVCGGRLLYRPTSEGQTSDTGWTVADLTVVSDTALADGDRAVELAGTIPAAVVTTTGIDYYLEATQDQRVTFVPTSVEASAGGVTVADGQAWYHVVTVAPPLVVHEPPSVTFAGRDRDLRLSASCSTGSCTATVFWRVSEAGVVDEPLTEVPNWNSMSMEPTATTGVGDPGAWVDYEAVVPAADVTTDGLDYVFAVGDGHTTTWWPGTMWEGHVSARDGMRTGYVHLSVLEPPHLVHVPVASSPYGEPIDIRATTNCPTATGCQATLYYRAAQRSALDPVDDFTEAAMDVATVTTAGGVDVVEATGTVPAEVADTRGVDYFIGVTDAQATGWWPGTSDTGGYEPVDGVRVAYHHTRVLEPPRIVHATRPVADPLVEYPVEVTLTCATEACEATLYYAGTTAGVTQALSAAYTALPMTAHGDPVRTAAGTVQSYRAVIPADQVTTRGLAYFIHATDGHTNTYSPGTDYHGAYLPVDGQHAGVVAAGDATGAGGPGAGSTYVGVGPVEATITPSGSSLLNLQAGLAWPVRVLESPHPAVVGPAFAERFEPMEVTAASNCHTPDCQVTLRWASVDHTVEEAVALAELTSTWHTETMAADGLTDDLDLWTATIPAREDDDVALLVQVEVDDGYVTERSALHPITLINGRVDRALPATGDMTVTVDGTTPPADRLHVRAGHSETLIGFDTSAVPAGVEVFEARLQMEVADGTGTVTAARNTGAWDAATTWADRPATTSPATAVGLAAPDTPLMIDITSLAAGWIDGSVPNHGVTLRADPLPLSTIAMASSRHTEPTLRPTLYVTYASADHQPPVVEITSPEDQQTVFHDLAVTVDVEDPGFQDDQTGSQVNSNLLATGVQRVELLVDGTVVDTATTEPWTTRWDTRTIADGSHELAVRAIDGAGNRSVSTPVAVTVANGFNALQRLDADHEAGLITTSQHTRWSLYALFDQRGIPEQYRSDTPIEQEFAPATWELLSRAAELPEEDLAEIDSFFDPQFVEEQQTESMSLSSSTKSATTGESPCEGLVRRTLGWLLPAGVEETIDWCVASSPHFTVMYRTDSGNPDNDVNPTDVLDGTLAYGSGSNGVPDQVDQVIAELEAAYTLYAASDGLDMLEPYDQQPGLVFLIDLSTVHDEAPSGFASPTRSRWIAMSPDTRNPGYLARHELYHQFQYEYLLHRLSLPFSGVRGPDFAEYVDFAPHGVRWLLEATADWAAGHAAANPAAPPTIDADPAAHTLRLPDRLQDPTRPIDAGAGFALDRTDASAAYGSFIVFEGLEEEAQRHQPGVDGRLVVRDIWVDVYDQGSPPNVRAAIDTALGLRGSSLTTFLPQAAIANYRLAPNPTDQRYGFIDPFAAVWQQRLDDSVLTSGDPNPVGDGLDRARAGHETIEVPTATAVSRTVSLEKTGTGYIDVVNGLGGRLRAFISGVGPDYAKGVVVDAIQWADRAPDICSVQRLKDASGTVASAVIQLDPNCGAVSIVLTRTDWEYGEFESFNEPLPPIDVDLDISRERIDGAVLPGPVVRLGTDEDGTLGYHHPNTIRPQDIGLLHVNTGSEGILSASGCCHTASDSWAVADAETGLTGGVTGDGDRYGSYQGGSLSGSRYTAVTATATVGTVGAVDVPVLEVAHTFSDSPDPRLKQIEVTITNSSPHAAADVRYRRAIEYEVEPTPHEQFVTLLERTGPLPELLYSSNDGFAVPDPLAGPSDSGVTGTFTDYGPGNFGYLIDLGLGQLAPAGTVSFTLYVGAAVSETSALAAIDDVAADLYGLSQSNTPNGPADGTPVTFIFGYRR